MLTGYIWEWFNAEKVDHPKPRTPPAAHEERRECHREHAEKRLQGQTETNVDSNATGRGGSSYPTLTTHGPTTRQPVPNPTATPLFQHQIEVVDRALASDHLGIFLDQGLGKTRCALEVVQTLDMSPVIVVCPATVIGVWLDEVRKWASGWSAIPLIGTRAQRLALIKKCVNEQRMIGVINYEGIRIWTKKQYWLTNDGSRRWRWGNEIAERYPWQVAILDESSKIKGPTTKQSHACHALENVPRRYLLTGTPIPKNPLDIWSQFRFLCPDEFGRNFKDFEARYAVKRQIFSHTGKPISVIVGIRSEKNLLERAAKHSIRRRKAECLDLPEKIKQKEIVTLDGDQQAAYNVFAKDMVASIGNQTVSATGVLPKILRLQEILQGFSRTDEKNVVFFKSQAKSRALGDILDRIMGDHMAVIWYRFTPEEQIIRTVAKSVGVKRIASINGRVPISERPAIIASFQDGKHDIMLCQYQTCSYGVTLTAADYSIFFSQSWDLELKLQASDRLHRIGQTRSVVEIDIVAQKTLDDAILEACERKLKWASRFDAVMLRGLVDGDATSSTKMGV